MTVYNAEESESDRRAKRFVLNSLGEEILKYLHDPNITEVYVNQDNMLRIESYSGRFNTEIKLTDDHIKRVCEAISGYNKEIIREDKPMLAVELSNLYLRAQLMYPPLTKKPTFFLRKKPERIFTLEEYIELGTISEPYATYLLDAISKRKNILVVGGTGSGKTTFLNALINKLSIIAPKERILILEDTPELQCNSDDVQRLQLPANRNTIATMQDLVYVSLRLSPERIIVGEVRDKSAYDLLKAWNTGHSGGFSTFHADSAYDALDRLEAMITESQQVNAGNIETIKRMIGKTIDCIIFLEKKSIDGKTVRCVEEVMEVSSYDITKHDYDVIYV